MKKFLISLCFCFISTFAISQDTLPNFSVLNLGQDGAGNARVVISWVNNFDSLKQISIQTSHDSLKNYRTLISLTDPNARTNGYADRKALNDHMFYRLFILKGDGSYVFSTPKRPMIDTTRPVILPETKNPVVEKQKTPDFVPSFYVYTNREGYVYINLPDAEKQKYKIKFYEENNDLLFEIKNIRQGGLTLDKTNFMHAGWYFFELFNDERLIERHKFYLAKEY